MDQAVKDAVIELSKAERRCALDKDQICAVRYAARRLLVRAIRHLVYPDRDVYPKSRQSRKSHLYMGNL